MSSQPALSFKQLSLASMKILLFLQVQFCRKQGYTDLFLFLYSQYILGAYGDILASAENYGSIQILGLKSSAKFATSPTQFRFNSPYATAANNFINFAIYPEHQHLALCLTLFQTSIENMKFGAI